MLLAVDTSTAQVGLALYDGSQVIGEYAWRSRQRHTVELAPAVFELLTRCGLTMDDIQALGVALGPGSFTSLRVVLATAQPLSKLPLLAAIQAGRGRLAAGWYKRSKGDWRAKGPAHVLTVKALVEEVKGPALVCAELTAEERQTLLGNSAIQLVSPAQSVRRPAILAELAWRRWQAGDVDDRAALAPIYLHTAEPIPT